MEYELAKLEELQTIYEVVQETIKTIYPKYYPKEVVDFFCQHHSKEKIKKDIESGFVGVVRDDGIIIATGCHVENYIARVYVLPDYQKRGIGRFIIQTIEEEIRKQYAEVSLDASLPAAVVYEKLGYVTKSHEKLLVENDVVLAYEIMEKEFHNVDTKINYDGRCFVPKTNSENGEVSGLTRFFYHQNGNLLWAEYSGGEILKGTLLGTVSDQGELTFTYQHMNQALESKSGICHSTPRIHENGKLQLIEKWQWTVGDCSEGESLLEEI